MPWLAEMVGSIFNGKRCALAVLAALLFPFCLGSALAESAVQPAPPIGASTADLSAKSKADPDSFCPSSVPPETPPEADTPRATLEIVPSTRWQPVGGEVQFEISGMDKPVENLSVYFAWQERTSKESGYCHRSLRVRHLPQQPGDDEKTYRYAARVPHLDKDAIGLPWIEGVHRRTWTSTVPLADMYVHGAVQGEDKRDISITVASAVGISTPWPAFVVAGLSAIAILWLLAWCAKSKGIRGDPILRIISTANGTASLSQFQILLWTLVIATGVVYVIMLSGNLIDVPATMLGLLGVSGLSLVGSKLNAGSDGSPQRVNPPGLVNSLSIVGVPTSSNIVLSWVPPAGAEQPLAYTIRMRPAGATNPWTTVATEIGGPPFAVSGLSPNTSFDFEVYATNPGGAGPASVAATGTTLAGVAGGTGGLARVTGLSAQAEDDGCVLLTWTALAPAPTAYTVQYRETGTFSWATCSSSVLVPKVIVALLDGSTSYDFQVFAVTDGVAGSPSDVAVAKTVGRFPSWSDLVMSDDSQTEIDLARLQMLVFTSLAAVFTALMLINVGEIPNIPIGELALVGVSNGVYLASKASKR
jgi:hypothetical protein